MASSLQSATAAFESAPSFTSVQELTKEQIITVPQTYIRFDQNSPLHSSPSPISIPTIDLSRLLRSEEDDNDDAEIQKLHSICKHWGLFQLVNHGVSSALLEELKHELEEFFNLPLEEKLKYRIRPGEFEGYGYAARAGGKLDWADRFYMITNPLHRRKPHLLPELPSTYRKTLESYLMELQKLAMKLFGLIGKALKIEKKEMEEMFDDGMQSLRMTYYPPCPQPEKVVGISPHSDATGITILNQVNGVDGFQIKKEGVWFPVSILPDSLVVNVGDILEILSNGEYHSMEHRVAINSEKERMSISFFVNPKFEAEVGPSLRLISPQNPPLYKRIGMEQYVKGFFSRRLDGRTYLDHMKIQNIEEPPSTNITTTAST